MREPVFTRSNVPSGDDACALFASCQFITITNCLFSTRWAAFRFGAGIARNIAVSNCVLRQVLGCPIKLRCQPGSIYENMSFSNLLFDDVSGPISIGAGTQRPSDPPAPGTGGIVRNISFSNISGTVVTKPTPLDNSTMTGVSNAGGTALVHHPERRTGQYDREHLAQRRPLDVRRRRHGGGRRAARAAAHRQ